MNSQLRKVLTWIVLPTFFLLTFLLHPPNRVFALPLAQDGIPTSAQVIEAVNSLLLAYGMPPLNVHPVLMQVAQWEADTLAGTEGAYGHVRPPA